MSESKLTMEQVRRLLDSRRIPYQDPGEDLQLILRGTADLIEGYFGDWEYWVRGTLIKEPITLSFATLEELGTHLDAHYVQQPYDEWSAKPLPPLD